MLRTPAPLPIDGDALVDRCASRDGFGRHHPAPAPPRSSDGWRWPAHSLAGPRRSGWASAVRRVPAMAESGRLWSGLGAVVRHGRGAAPAGHEPAYRI